MRCFVFLYKNNSYRFSNVTDTLQDLCVLLGCAWVAIAIEHAFQISFAFVPFIQYLLCIYKTDSQMKLSCHYKSLLIVGFVSDFYICAKIKIQQENTKNRPFPLFQENWRFQFIRYCNLSQFQIFM